MLGFIYIHSLRTSSVTAPSLIAGLAPVSNGLPSNALSNSFARPLANGFISSMLLILLLIFGFNLPSFHTV